MRKSQLRSTWGSSGGEATSKRVLPPWESRQGWWGVVSSLSALGLFLVGYFTALGWNDESPSIVLDWFARITLALGAGMLLLGMLVMASRQRTVSPWAIAALIVTMSWLTTRFLEPLLDQAAPAAFVQDMFMWFLPVAAFATWSLTLSALAKSLGHPKLAGYVIRLVLLYIGFQSVCFLTWLAVRRNLVPGPLSGFRYQIKVLAELTSCLWLATHASQLCIKQPDE